MVSVAAQHLAQRYCLPGEAVAVVAVLSLVQQVEVAVVEVVRQMVQLEPLLLVLVVGRERQRSRWLTHRWQEQAGQSRLSRHTTATLVVVVVADILLHLRVASEVHRVMVAVVAAMVAEK